MASARYDDFLALTATVTDVRRRSFRVEHSVTKNGEEIAAGYEVRIWVTLAGEVPQATVLPERLVEALRDSTEPIS